MFEEHFKFSPVGPPRDLKLLPGLAYKQAIPSGSWAFTLLLPLALFALFATIFLNTPSGRLKLGSTRLAQARVVSIADARSCGGAPARRVVYSFTVGDKSEERGAANACDSSIYYQSQTGDTLPIEYLVRDPHINRIVGMTDNDDLPPAILFGFPVFLSLVLIGGFLQPPLRAVRRARRLFGNGGLALGTVIFIRRSNIFGGSNRALGEAQVYISYLHPDGNRQEAWVRCNNEWLLQLLRPGSEVHIAYSTRKPTEIAMLEAFIR